MSFYSKTLSLLMCFVAVSMSIHPLWSAEEERKQSDDSSVEALVVAEAYLNNRELPPLACKLIVTVGKSRTNDHSTAVSANNFRKSLSASGTWILREPVERFELIVDPLEMRPFLDEKNAIRVDSDKKSVESKQFSVPLISEAYLGTYEHHLTFSREVGAAILSGPRVGAQPTLTPFAMGIMGGGESNSPVAKIKKSVGQANRQVRVSKIDVSGAEMVRVQIFEANHTIPYVEYSFDPARNYLLMEALGRDSKSGQSKFVAKVLDAEQLPQGNWFPTRSVLIAGKADSEGLYFVREIKVTDLNSSVSPSDEMLTLDLPGGSTISNGVDIKSVVQLTHPVKIRSNQLVEFNANLKSIVSGNPPVMVVDPEKKNISVGLVLALNGLVAVIVLCWYRLSRSRK